VWLTLQRPLNEDKEVDEGGEVIIKEEEEEDIAVVLKEE